MELWVMGPEVLLIPWVIDASQDDRPTARVDNGSAPSREEPLRRRRRYNQRDECRCRYDENNQQRCNYASHAKSSAVHLGGKFTIGLLFAWLGVGGYGSQGYVRLRYTRLYGDINVPSIAHECTTPV